MVDYQEDDKVPVLAAPDPVNAALDDYAQSVIPKKKALVLKNLGFKKIAFVDYGSRDDSLVTKKVPATAAELIKMFEDRLSTRTNRIRTEMKLKGLGFKKTNA